MTKSIVMLFVLMCVLAPAATACGNCENDPTPTCIKSDRWPVKTLTDLDQSLVNLTRVNYNISGFHSILRPVAMDGSGRDPNHRVFPEFTTFRMYANLKWVALMDDEDMHMVISDIVDPTKVVTVEIPAPDCVSTALAPTMLSLRQKVEQVTGPLIPGGQYVFLSQVTPVVISGIPFWDTKHGQPDQGPNYLELHPVLNVEFPTPCPIPTTRTVNLCLPPSSVIVGSSVHVVATANTTSLSGMTVYADGVVVYSTAGNHIDMKVTYQTSGSHRVTVTAHDTGGDYWKTVYFTVQ